MLGVKVDDISNMFSELQEDYEAKIKKYNQLLERKSELVSGMSDIKVQIERCENIVSQNIEKAQSKKQLLEELKQKFELQDNDGKLSILKSKAYDIEKEIKSFDRNRTSIINNLADWKAKSKLYTKQKDEYGKLNSSLKLYDMFSQAVSKRGIPVQIIHSMLPRINSEISKILQGVVGFTVELEADLDSNAMDIYINYGDSRRIVELGSGMEKMMASLAIRVALINVSTLPKTNMLIIDEGFGALDETNLEACGKLLHSLKKWFKNILVISHIDAIKDIVDNTIDITRKGVDSYVYQP
jgi:exonuclease SbcC